MSIYYVIASIVGILFWILDLKLALAAGWATGICMSAFFLAFTAGFLAIRMYLNS